MKEIKRIKRQDYKVILVYPLVPSEELIIRAKQRELETGQTPASDEIIKSDINNAINNILKLINHVDALYIYDNSGTKGNEKIVIEVKNMWEWTPEESLYGAGLNRKVTCDCNNLKTMSKLFATEIMKVLNEICDISCN